MFNEFKNEGADDEKKNPTLHQFQEFSRLKFLQ